MGREPTTTKKEQPRNKRYQEYKGKTGCLSQKSLIGYRIYNNSSLSINNFSLTTGHLYVIMKILDNSQLFQVALIEFS